MVVVVKQTDTARAQEASSLYERYVEPLETTHSGEFVAVAPNGAIVLGTAMLDVAQQAKATLGPGCYLFRVGDRVAGKWR
jgi:hypothetical protein